MTDQKPSTLVQQLVETKVSTEEEWAKLMQEPDPLQDTDIYATEKKDGYQAPSVNSEESDLEFDISDVLNKSFKTERNRSSLVQNIPTIIQKKDDASYAKMFKGLTVQDVKNIDG